MHASSAAQSEIIEGDERDIGELDTEFVEGLHSADRHQVICDKDGVRWIRMPEKIIGGAIATLDMVVPIDDKSLPIAAPGRFEGFSVSSESLRPARSAFGPSNDSDVLIASFDECGSGQLSAADVVENDRVEFGGTQFTIHRHDRDTVPSECRHIRVGFVGGRNDQTSYLLIHQELDVLPFG